MMNCENIPITEQLSSGSLKGSGVKYYICENDNPNDTVVLTLIVHVGSLMEKDDEQGLAHFIEHLGFKSTKSFEHYQLVKFLESLGISYGPDLNASTHLLETVFRLNIKYDEECSQMAMGINVLSEWAYHMSISEKDVVEERQVISAEYMAKQGVGNRLLKQYWKAIFDTSNSELAVCEASSLLSKRFPIGIPEVFMHCDHTHIRRFYQKWYHPENMSVLVCGSLHGRQREIVDLLEKSFALPSGVPSLRVPLPTLPLSEDTPSTPSRCQQLQEQYLVLPSLHKTSDVVVAMEDPDLTCTQICVEFFSPVQKSRTTNFFRQDILRRLMSSLLDKRFNELHKNRGTLPLDVIGMPPNSQNIASPFLSVQISIREFVRGLVCIGVSATLKDIIEDDSDHNTEDITAREPSTVTTVNVAIQCLLLEMKRLRLLGVNSIELDKAKGKWITFFRHQHQKKFVDNAYMVSELQNFVVNGENVPFATPSTEAKICMDIISSITLAEMNEFLRDTFDMDVMEKDSVYYNEAGRHEQCFRALSGQFPRPLMHKGANSPLLTAVSTDTLSPDEKLRTMLMTAREIVAARDGSCLDQWPCNEQIEEAQVLAFAQEALDDASGGEDDKEDTVTENAVESLQCSEFLLSNGITVCCKWMPEESQGKVSMQGFALGGSSELSPVEDLLMSGLDEMAGLSTSVTGTATGSNVLEGKDVLELQSVANTRVNTQRHQYHRGIGGSTTPEKLELLLAFLVIRMTSQNIDEIQFEDWISKKRSQLTNQSNSPEFAFMNRSRILACGDDPTARPITLQLLQEAGSGHCVASDLYDKAFKADPTEFSFVFTGDIGDKAKFKELLVTYLGKLRPNVNLLQRIGKWLPSVSPVKCSDSDLHPFTLLNSSSHIYCGPIEESMHLLKAEDNKASMMTIFRADTKCFLCDDEDLQFVTSLDAACRVLQVYLLDELRIKLGKVYNVNVEKSRGSLSTFFLISIGLHCQPSDVDVVKDAIKTILVQLQTTGPESDKLNSVAEAMCKTHKDASSNSSYWLFWILDSYKAYKLHEWRCNRNPAAFVKEASSSWLARNGYIRATGRILQIKEELTCSVLQNIYQTIFGWNQSILMKLLPVDVDEGGDISVRLSGEGSTQEETTDSLVEVAA